ncbi:hypothetical protein L204_105270 [Cryptococcus depauperatus]
MSPTTTIPKLLAVAPGVKGHLNSGIMEGSDGRSRNAKAQKRHREKQKARVKALEESVQMLTVQLEDAKLQLGQLSYPAGGNRIPGATHSPDYVQLQAENAYLRKENSDLRRQIYILRNTYGGPPDVDTTTELGASPPLRQGDIHEHYTSAGIQPSHQTSSSVDGDTPTTASFQSSTRDPFAHAPGRDSRTRILSTSSAPSAASPYPGSSAPFCDPRPLPNAVNKPAITITTTANGINQVESRYPMRYESYSYPSNTPRPHSLPSSQAVYGVEGLSGYPRDKDNQNIWSSESTPHFPMAMNYNSVGFHESPTVQTPDSWRQAP